jgi:CheY-like chemotaxis protein
LDSIRPAAEAKSIQLQVQFVAPGSLIAGDPARLQQIVWNLLSNAVKFTPVHGRIEIGIEYINSHLQLKVSDSGVGISPEFLPRVFDRFSQANTSSERKYGGLGLGLAIVRHLVELHGGTICADSLGEGQGATFTVMLPVRAMHEESGEFKRTDTSAEYMASLTEAIRLDGLRVMVVDDEAESRELLFAMLNNRGAEVKACASAAEALVALARWRPAVLVSDIGMPGEDGYTLIRRLRALDPARVGDIPAVALTGYARNEDRMRALAAGFQMHVSKPVEPVELIVIIASLAGRLDQGGMEKER